LKHGWPIEAGVKLLADVIAFAELEEQHRIYNEVSVSSHAGLGTKAIFAEWIF
jgi:hypothetical protein